MFVDTNVFVGARLRHAPYHERARDVLARAERSAEPARISRQVLREYVSAVTRPQSWSEPRPMTEALRDLALLGSTFEILEDGPRVMTVLAVLCGEVPVAGKQVHDANIVATMLAHGERRLLTFNRGDFRRYGQRIELMDTEAT